MAMMVVRTGDGVTLGVASGVALMFGGLMSMRVPPEDLEVPTEAVKLQVVQGFKWMAVEGLTVFDFSCIYQQRSCSVST